MTPEEIKAFIEIAELAITETFSRSLGKHEGELFKLVQAAPSFQRLVHNGTREALRSFGFEGPATGETKITCTVQEIFVTTAIAISVGMDLAVAMQRFGAKFPPPVVN